MSDLMRDPLSTREFAAELALDEADARLTRMVAKMVREGVPMSSEVPGTWDWLVFRIVSTGRFDSVTAEFGNVTGHFGDVTDGVLQAA